MIEQEAESIGKFISSACEIKRRFPQINKKLQKIVYYVIVQVSNMVHLLCAYTIWHNNMLTSSTSKRLNTEDEGTFLSYITIVKERSLIKLPNKHIPEFGDICKFLSKILFS